MDQPRDDHEQKKQYPRPSANSANNLVSHKPSINVKPVDEDLYKIPSQLVENSKRVRSHLIITTFLLQIYYPR